MVEHYQVYTVQLASVLSVRTVTRAGTAATVASGEPSLTVQTPYINEHGSGWFYFLASGPTGTYAADHRQHCIRRLDIDTGLQCLAFKIPCQFVLTQQDNTICFRHMA